jgi:Alpha/beta hydrolase of unknown function (DUF900)
MKNTVPRAVAAAFALAVTCGAAGLDAAAAPVLEPNPLAPAVSRVVVLDGRVTSVGATPVARADVRLLQNGRVVVNALSDAQGAYRFSNASPDSDIPPLVPPGPYTLEAQYRGTTKIAGTVLIRADATAHRNITLGAIARKGGAILAPRSTMIVTDRVAGAVPSLGTAFTNERPILSCQPAPGCALHFGVVRATGPILGAVEPATDMDAFMTLMRATYPSATSVTIFVHGFNNDFEGPVRTAASAVASVAPQTVPLAYSWPSKNKTAKYLDDETNNAWAAEHFRDFLLAMLQRPDGPKTVNVVAHSMGNRVALSALQFIARAKPTLNGSIGQVVFAAPDVDATTFWEAIPSMAAAAQGLTVYSSSHDQALQLSRELHGHCRAGLTGCNDAGLLPANVNAIDASFFHCDVIGHGYWAASTTILGDITAVMSAGTMAPGAPARAHLAAMSPGRFRFTSPAPGDGTCAAEPSH